MNQKPNKDIQFNNDMNYFNDNQTRSVRMPIMNNQSNQPNIYSQNSWPSSNNMNKNQLHQNIKEEIIKNNIDYQQQIMKMIGANNYANQNIFQQENKKNGTIPMTINDNHELNFPVKSNENENYDFNENIQQKNQELNFDKQFQRHKLIREKQISKQNRKMERELMNKNYLNNQYQQNHQKFGQMKNQEFFLNSNNQNDNQYWMKNLANKINSNWYDSKFNVGGNSQNPQNFYPGVVQPPISQYQNFNPGVMQPLVSQYQNFNPGVMQPLVSQYQNFNPGVVQTPVHQYQNFNQESGIQTSSLASLGQEYFPQNYQNSQYFFPQEFAPHIYDGSKNYAYIDLNNRNNNFQELLQNNNVITKMNSFNQQPFKATINNSYFAPQNQHLFNNPFNNQSLYGEQKWSLDYLNNLLKLKMISYSDYLRQKEEILKRNIY